jgi:peptidyl-prolyl cis-trans isomerase D
MPLMTKMRDNMPAILIGLVIAFVVMIIFEWGMDFGGMRGARQNVLGKVNDREITYQHFSEVLRNVTEMQRQQFGGEIDEQFMGFIREQVWENLVNEILLEEEIRRRGIRVTDDEIVNWVYGENPPQFLTQQFVDEEGNFDRIAYDMALSDPRNREQVIQLEQMLRQQRMQEKLQSLLMASVRVTEGEIRQRFKEQNIRMDVKYAALDPNRIIPADAVTVTDEEIQRYFNANPQQFKSPPQRKLEFVSFPFAPSAADTNDAVKEIEYYKQRLDEGEDFLELVENYSHTPFADAFFKPGELTPEKERVLFAGEPGDVIGPIVDGDGAHLIKIIDTRTGREEFVRAQHILLQFDEETDSAVVFEQADELIAQLQDGVDFEHLARRYSKDPGSGQRGGDLGWFGRGRMVPPFEQAAFGARVGEIVGPVESQFGMHIIKVNDRTNREVKFATIHQPVEVSPFTRNEIFDRASDFAYIAQQRDFQDEAAYLGLEVRETAFFTEDGIISGVGRNESVMRFAFENRRGRISDVLELTNGYGVFKISDVQREGVKPLDEVRSQIRADLLRDKRWEKARERAQEIYGKLESGSLNKITEIDPTIELQTANDIGINSNIPGVGRDEKFIGAAFGLEQGVVSKPFEGSRHIYLIELVQRTEFDEGKYADQYENIKQELLGSKRQEFFRQWLEGLREDAKIVDNRYMFYR